MTYPNKPTNNDYPINDLIKKRWSPRVFADKLIEPEKIKSLFEAARWTQSSRNEQPWRFVYATSDKQEDFERLTSLLTEGNAWAKKVPLLMVIFAKKTFDYNDKSNYNAMYDTGAAASNLFLEAINQGLYAHEMIGFDIERAQTELGVPENFKPAAMMAVGYPADLADLENLTEDQRKSELAERSRLKQEEFVFEGKWK